MELSERKFEVRLWREDLSGFYRYFLKTVVLDLDDFERALDAFEKDSTISIRKFRTATLIGISLVREQIYFFRSAVREFGNFNHWDLDFTEKKLYKSYEMKCLNYNHNGDEWYDKGCRPQTMYGTGAHAIIHIRWKNYDFDK